AEVEAFLDTPVKHYSSGMYTRLAFAVAAHLECEILLVDEVLAVGDASFQRRCMARMSSVAGEGRTVLVVSHNMSAVRQLCALSDLHIDAGTNLANRLERSTGSTRFSGVTVVDAAGKPCWTFRSGETVRFELAIEVFEPTTDLSVYLALHSGPGSEVITTI